MFSTIHVGIYLVFKDNGKKNLSKVVFYIKLGQTPFYSRINRQVVMEIPNYEDILEVIRVNMMLLRVHLC